MIRRALLAAAGSPRPPRAAPAARSQTFTPAVLVAPRGELHPPSAWAAGASWSSARSGTGPTQSCERVVVSVEGLDENGRTVSRAPRLRLRRRAVARLLDASRSAWRRPALSAASGVEIESLPVRLVRELTLPGCEEAETPPPRPSPAPDLTPRPSAPRGPGPAAPPIAVTPACRRLPRPAMVEQRGLPIVAELAPRARGPSRRGPSSKARWRSSSGPTGRAIPTSSGLFLQRLDAARHDKQFRLTLAWQREQIRLSLEDILAGRRPRPAPSGPGWTRARWPR